jgi:hypothetical protein
MLLKMREIDVKVSENVIQLCEGSPTFVPFDIDSMLVAFRAAFANANSWSTFPLATDATFPNVPCVPFSPPPFASFTPMAFFPLPPPFIVGVCC